MVATRLAVDPAKVHVAAAGLDVGLAVGAEVGLAVGAEVGLAVGAEVGLAVGAEVGLVVGLAEADAVGAVVGADVGVGGVEVLELHAAMISVISAPHATASERFERDGIDKDPP